MNYQLFSKFFVRIIFLLLLSDCFFDANPPSLSKRNAIYPEITFQISSLTKPSSIILRYWDQNEVYVFGPKFHFKTDAYNSYIGSFTLTDSTTKYSFMLILDFNNNAIADSGDQAFLSLNNSVSFNATRSTIFRLTSNDFTSLVKVSVKNTNNYIASKQYTCIFNPATTSVWSSSSKGNNLFGVTALNEWLPYAKFASDGAGNLDATSEKVAYLVANQNYGGVCVVGEVGQYISSGVVKSILTFNAGASGTSDYTVQ